MAERLRELMTASLSADELAALRAMFAAAWLVGFDDHDFAHALGGTHWLVEVDGAIVSHTSVVERELQAGGRPLRSGYLEAVATLPRHGRRGYGTRTVAAAGEYIRSRFELGALSTGRPSFYERLGWESWRGPTFVRMPDGTLRRTPDEDDGILIMRTPSTPADLDTAAALSCDWRPGDVW